MRKKKPVPIEKTKSDKINQMESKKPLPVEETSETPPLLVTNDTPSSDTLNTIDNDRPVSLSEVLQLKMSLQNAGSKRLMQFLPRPTGSRASR